MNLVTRVHEIAMTQPEKAAYHFMGKDTSYAEFDQSVSMFASALQDLGVGKGDHVAFLLGNTPHFLISLYATMRIGATAIPVNPIYTPDEISYIIHNSDAKAVIALDLLLPLVEQAAGAFPTVEHYVICETVPETPEKIAALPAAVRSKVRSFTQLIATGRPNQEPVAVDENETAIILYTSGTTGQPKGAMLTHGNLYSNARDVADYLDFTEDDRVVATLAGIPCLRAYSCCQCATSERCNDFTSTALQSSRGIQSRQGTAGDYFRGCTDNVQFLIPVPRR